MLAKFEDVKKIMICPKSGYPLIQKGAVFFPVCDGRSSKFEYRCLDKHPVLVDFENTLLDEATIYDTQSMSIFQKRTSRKLLRRIKKYLFYPAANRLVARIAERYAWELKKQKRNPKILMIGAGTKGMGCEIFYNDPDIQVISFDIYASPITHFIADAHNIPIESGVIDGVWIQYVLEHVLNPWKVLEEIKRVLCDAGLVYAETAFLQQVHEGACDFVRFTHSGHRWLFHDFTEIESGISMGPGSQLLWTLEHNVRGISRSLYLGKIVKACFFWLRIIEKLMPVRYSFDNASSFYFWGKKANKPLDLKELIKYYKGALLSQG